MLATATPAEAVMGTNALELAAGASAALTRLLAAVAKSDYRFTTPTPATHQRYLADSGRAIATTLRDIFGWNLPFARSLLRPSMLQEMRDAGVLMPHATPPYRSGCMTPDQTTLYRSAVRIARLDGDVFLHSGFPTEAPESVFFGPDTYRFARFVQSALPDFMPSRASASVAGPPIRILDLGCGTGAGGIVAARAMRQRGNACHVTMSDINPAALRYTAVNAAVADIAVELAHGDGLAAAVGAFDLIVANPPYLFDDARRTYRHGGAGLGRALSVQFVKQSLLRLAPGGQLLLYTGVAIVNGDDGFLDEITPLVSQAGCAWSYAEIDPDVFGEELSRPMYRHVDRIAAVGLCVRRPPAV